MLELNIAETGVFTWIQSMFLSRFLIGFEIFLGVMLISRAYRKLTWIACIATLGLFTVYLLHLIINMPGINDCGCMGIAMPLSPEHSIYKNAALIAISFLIWFLEGKYPSKWLNDIVSSKWILALAILISFSLPFVLNPLSFEKAEKLSKDELLTTTLDLSDESFFTWQCNDTLQINPGKKLVCFFSPGCKFCRMAARKIRVFQNNRDNPFSVYFLFAGNPASRNKLEPFYTETMTESIPTAIIEEGKFFNVSGPNLPAIFYVNGTVIEGKDNFLTLSEEKIDRFFESAE